MRTPLPMLDAMLDALTDDDIRDIAASDYGVDADRHYAALNALIVARGVPAEGQFWYPYEVIVLCSNALSAGRETTFAACTLLVLQAVRLGYDTMTNLDAKFADRSQDYDRLPCELCDAIVAAYVLAQEPADAMTCR